MSDPTTAREALLAEAIGDVGKLLNRVEAIAPAIDGTSRAFVQARLDMEEQLSAVERRMTAITEYAKSDVAKYISAQTERATRWSIDQQSRAMADAARVAFGAEVGATVQRLQVTLHRLLERRKQQWESWLTHATAAMAAAGATLALALYFCRC